MQLQKIQEVDLTNKRVLLRADFNVSIDEQGRAKETYKIAAAKETVDYIMSFKGVKLAMISHLGRPASPEDKKFSLIHLKDEVAQTFGFPTAFVCDCIGVCVQRAMEEHKDGQILLLENLRYHEGEKQNDAVFASQLVTAFDVYVNDAFSVTHREHASVHSITKCIDSYAGIWLQREVEMLSKAKEASQMPSVAIIGGAKIQTKLPLIKTLENTYTNILVGGKTATEALDEKITFSDRVFLPEDFAGDNRYDIGPKTINTFKVLIRESKLIIWNGPLGKFEQPPFDTGTNEIAKEIAHNKEAFSIVGGGESVQALRSLGYDKDVSFVSTGGGAMLAFMADESMPGLEVLQK